MQKIIALRIALLFVSTLSSTALAQEWQQLHQFPGYISFVKLYNRLLFVGSGIAPDGDHGRTSLFRSSDKGKTWLQCTIPTGNSAKLSDLIMLDDRVGFAAIWGDGSRSGLWKTTNGGADWAETGVGGCLTCIVGDSHRLIATDLFGNARVSYNGGKSFSLLPAIGTNHVAFLDKLHGAMPNYRGNGFWYTSDGGESWQCSDQDVECWSICADTTSASFFAAPECGTGSNSHTQLFRSTTYGHSWSVVSELPIVTTGHIVCTSAGQLIVQGLAGVNGSRGGLYNSYDRGLHWSSLGGPSAAADTRFIAYPSCSGVVIYAFDEKNQGSLYRYGRPDDDLYYNTYFSNQMAKIDSVLDVPLAVRLPLKYGVQHRDVRHIDFSVISSADALVIEGFNAPKGWRLVGLSSKQNSLQISLDRVVATSPGDSCGLGELSLHAVHSGKSTISIEDVVIEDDSETVGLCSVPEGQAVSSVTVLERLAVNPHSSLSRLTINGTTFDLDKELDAQVTIRVVDRDGATVDERTVTPVGAEIDLQLPKRLHGLFFVILTDGTWSKILKVITD